MPCDGLPCDADRWVVFGLEAVDVPADQPDEPNRPRVFIDTPCGRVKYRIRLDVDAARLPFGAPDASRPLIGALSWSARPAGGLELAIVELDGDLSIFELGQTQARRSAALRGVGVAWSNAGDRLAVVTCDASQPASRAHQLLILSPTLEEVARFLLDLPLSERDQNLIHDRFVVSWNADDTQIAVSTTVACSTGLATDACDQWRVIPRCTIVGLDDGRAQTLALYDAWFVGNATFVTIPASDEPHIAANMARRIERITLGPAGIASRQPLVGPVYLYSANAPAGVIVTEDPAMFGINSVARSVSLRSSDGLHKDPRVANVLLAASALNTKNLPLVLVPAEIGLPALQQAGLVPECP